MSGYAGREKPFEKVGADLYVKAMVLEDNKGRRAALVTSDLLGLPRDVAEPIVRRHRKTNWSETRVCSAEFLAYPCGALASLEGHIEGRIRRGVAGRRVYASASRKSG